MKSIWLLYSDLRAFFHTRKRVFLMIEGVLTLTIFSALLLHERLMPPQIVGACLIIGGALFAECVHPRWKAKKAVVQ